MSTSDAARTAAGTTAEQDTTPRAPVAPPQASRMSRDAFERRLFGVLRPLIIAFLLVITVFPFYYMVLLSFRPLDAVLQDPGALLPSRGEVDLGTYGDVLKSTASGGQGFLTFIKNSFFVAVGTVILTLLVSIPGAYAVATGPRPARRGC